jgi:hypothetical protein
MDAVYASGQKDQQESKDSDRHRHAGGVRRWFLSRLIS